MAIIVCPLSSVYEIVETRTPDRIVSLLDPHSRFPDLQRRRHLRVAMHDVLMDDPALIPPAAQHVKDVLTFVSDWDREAPMLVHCYAGISRSTATAFTIACALNPDTDEGQIARALRSASHTAWPNRRIIGHADAELGRAGRMVRAIEAIGAGRSWEDVGEATPFEIPSRFGTHP